MAEDAKGMEKSLQDLADAIVRAIRKGSPDDRKTLVDTLKAMDAKTPGISEETTAAKEFLQALIGLLEGRPVGADTLQMPYSAIYGDIAGRAMAAEGHGGGGVEQGLKEFLTQLSAGVVMVMRTGSEQDKKDLAKKLGEVEQGMPEALAEARNFVAALVSLLEGVSVADGFLSSEYARFFGKVVESSRNSSQ